MLLGPALPSPSWVLSNPSVSPGIWARGCWEWMTGPTRSPARLGLWSGNTWKGTGGDLGEGAVWKTSWRRKGPH